MRKIKCSNFQGKNLKQITKELITAYDRDEIERTQLEIGKTP